MSKIFRKTAFLKKKKNIYIYIYTNGNKATKQRIALKKIGSVSVLKFLQRPALDFPCNFSRDFLTDMHMYGRFLKVVLGLLAH